jgi:hypothetical protein
MKSQYVTPSKNLLLAATVLMLAGGLATALKASVLPPNANAFGKSYGEWSAEWWQWAFALPPEANHPFWAAPEDLDVTLGQSGKVWFLASPFGTAVREVTIPEGTALCLGILNNEASSLEPPPYYGGTAEEQAAVAKSWSDMITEVFCIVDGKPVEDMASYRIVSPQFTFAAPTPWVFGGEGGIGTAVSDGYFVILTPLSKGQHVIQCGGTLAEYLIDVTYIITVE